MSVTNILLVEDHVLTRMGTVMAINTDKENYRIIAEAGSVTEAIDILDKNTNIDLVLLDLMLPDGHGIEVVKHLRKTNSPAKVLVLSADNDKNNILQLMEVGIDGFVSKFTDIPTLFSAMESVCNGIEYFGKDISEIIHAVLTAKPTSEDHFTSREVEIIRLCAKGYIVKEIARNLEISSRTVENHKNNIFKKLGFNTTGELISYAYEHGIIHN
ncbi:MAG: response regulator transcription factor [Bacteroidales bacterium]|nr:response regulator transcription factor [Bacteroidales bacterium]